MTKLCFPCIFFVMLILSSCNSNRAENEPPKEKINATDLIKQADEFYRQREDLSKIRQCTVLLRNVRSNEPNNFEANWKLSKANYYLGDNSEDDKESSKAFKEGIEAGRQAQRIARDKPDGYFWTGANLGGQAQKSPLSGITSVGEIREMMQKVIEIQPDFQGASAYDILAQVELGTRLAGGSAEKAVEYLQKAYELDKTNAYVSLHLAEAYLALNRNAEAKKQIDIVLKMKIDPDYLPEYKDAQKQAQKLLDTKF